MSGLHVAVVGATGVVGGELMTGLAASSLPVDRVDAYGTARSAGRKMVFRDRPVEVRALREDTYRPVDLVLASAGREASLKWSPRFAADGAVVVDNSSAFRNHPDSPLVVPEVNPHALVPGATIIANPNCSTIQMVVALAPLHRRWSLTAVRVATYQSVSGAGTQAMTELTRAVEAHRTGTAFVPAVFPRSIAFDVLPHIGGFDADGESEEERKMRAETRRILELPDLPVSATCVRVPVYRGHSEAVWAAFAKPPSVNEARALLTQAGVTVMDHPEDTIYPSARDADGHPGVLVGRIRRDGADDHGLALWVVADNLLKGAATNAVQIAERLWASGRLPGGGS